MAVSANFHDREFPDIILKLSGARATVPNLHQSILNSLQMLFNERPAFLYEPVEVQNQFPWVRGSVIAFGVRSPHGEPNEYGRHLKQAIVDYEPRLARETLSVSFVEADGKTYGHWYFEIKAVLHQRNDGFRCIVDFNLDLDQATISA